MMFLFLFSELLDEYERVGKEELINISLKVGYLLCCYLLLIIVLIELFCNFFFFVKLLVYKSFKLKSIIWLFDRFYVKYWGFMGVLL